MSEKNQKDFDLQSIYDNTNDESNYSLIKMFEYIKGKVIKNQKK